MVDVTYSLCPVCLKQVPAQYVIRDDTTYMIKNCREHGNFSTVVWRGEPDRNNWCKNAEKSEHNTSCPELCGLCKNHLRSTCCAILNVTDRCNLKCSFCFAGELTNEEPSLDYIKQCLDDMSNKGVTHIHLSGGEPTTRNDIPEIAMYAVSKGFKYIQLNTNGIKISQEKAYAKELADAGISAVFLQFDSTEDNIYEIMRGRALMESKIKAIEHCDMAYLSVVLVPTLVPGVNHNNIGEIVKFGLNYVPAVKGIHFQPVTYVGRYPENPQNCYRLTLPEVLRAIETQTDGMILTNQFTPSSCDHPMCGFHAVFIYTNNKLRPLSKKQTNCCTTVTDARTVVRKNQNFVSLRWTRSKICCSNSGSDQSALSIDEFLNNLKRNSFTISAMAFQDEFNIDLNRLKSCSVHVYDKGKLIPFCAEYIYHKRKS